MKTNNVMLGVFALVLGVGSAFASLLTATPIYVRAKVTPSAPITCEVTEVACDNIGAFPCKVQVNVSAGSGITANTYQNSGCTVRLLDTDPTSTPKISSLTVFQVF